MPKALLGDYGGHLMTDGYEGYNAVVMQNGITHLACWAHARRKFIDVQRAQPKGKTGSADVALGLMGKLYGVERDLKEIDDITQRTLERNMRSVPVLDELRAWLDKRINAVPPKSKLGEALAYLDKYWPKLIRYVERGDLPIDNNRAENAIRPFVIGRKNWLFLAFRDRALGRLRVGLVDFPVARIVLVGLPPDPQRIVRIVLPQR
ncbi:MAG: transposase, partial [Azoarcus sp.]|nr:transposase [Azoarcus sp.]